MNEGNDYWNEGQILILTGDMVDQIRRITDFVQATGTLTVAPRFVNPDVSLLSGNVIAAAVIIPVVDASVFSVGVAYIWDDAPNAEEVTITLVDAVLNQLTIAAPGLVNGYTVAANAAISMSPTILDGVEFVIMPPGTVVPAAGALFDVSDRPTRQVGLVRLTDFTDDGEVYPDGSIPVAPAKVTMAAFDDLTNVALVGSAANLALNTDHRGAGTNSTEWDKIAGGVLGGVVYTPPAAIDISQYSIHSKVMAFMYIPTPVGGTITNLQIALGTDAANLFYWEIPLADIVYDAWNHYHMIMSEVDGVAGVGADLSAIGYVGIFITTSVAGATLANVLVDEVIVKRSLAVVASGDEDVIRQVTPADGLAPLFALSNAGFLHIYDVNADDWNRWREGSQIGVPMVEDTGVNTNPERYLVDNGFRSPPIDRAGAAATALYTAATVPARTAGMDTHIHWIKFFNHSGAPATVWLEAPAGTQVSVTVPLNDDEFVLIPCKPLPIGDNDILVNASANDVMAQIGGVEV